MQLSELIKASGKYDLTIFSQEAIDRIEQSIFQKNDKYFIKCLKRNKDIQVKLHTGTKTSVLFVQKHDLKDIAKAFEVWAKEQQFSFWS